MGPKDKLSLKLADLHQIAIDFGKHGNCVRTQDFLFFQHLRLRLELNDYKSKYSHKKEGMLLECLKSEIQINEKFEEYFRNDWISSIK